MLKNSLKCEHDVRSALFFFLLLSIIPHTFQNLQIIKWLEGSKWFDVERSALEQIAIQKSTQRLS